MLILYLLKKIKSGSRFTKKLTFIKRLAVKLGMLSMLFVVTVSYANDKKPIKKISYNVVRNHTVIGTINVSCDVGNGSTIYSLESDINVKFILHFSIKGEETSIYKNGILIHSSVFRKVNNKVKADHDVVYKNQNYHLENSETTKKLSLKAIQDNLVMLYFKEPKTIKSVYCDYIKRMAKVEALAEGVYKVDFLDGKYNIFYYENGKCVKVEANSSMFSVTLIPAKS